MPSWRRGGGLAAWALIGRSEPPARVITAGRSRPVASGSGAAAAGRAKATTSVPAAGRLSAPTMVPSHSTGAEGSLARATGAANVVTAMAVRTVKMRFGPTSGPFLGESLDHGLERRNHARM